MSTWFVIDFRYLSFSWYFDGSVAKVRVKPRQFQVAIRSMGKANGVWHSLVEGGLTNTGGEAEGHEAAGTSSKTRGSSSPRP
jgi:hypothetical protein